MLFESPYRGESHQLLHLRDYAPNDSSNRIHWKASARSQGFLVKEFQKEQGSDVFIYFDCYPAHQQSMVVLDRAASLAASMAFLIRRKEMDATFVFADRSFRVGSRDAQMHPLLDHLTEIMPGVVNVSNTDATPTENAMVLVIRSKNVTSILSSLPAARVVNVEDALSGMEPVEAADLQVRP